MTSAPALAGALIIVTALAAGPLQSVDAYFQGYWAQKYTPNWATLLDSVPNAVAGQAVCLPVLLGVALFLARRHRTWHPLAIVVAAEAAFYGGIGGMKVLFGRTAPAAGEGGFWQGGPLEHGWYGIAYPSGHAAEAILMYGAAAYLLRTYASPDMRVRKRLGWLVGLITMNAIVVAFYLGYHWPTDLIGGMIAGGLMLRIIVDVDRAIAAGRPVLGWRRTPATAQAPAPVPTRLPAPVPARLPAPTTTRSPALARTAQVVVPAERAPGQPRLQPAAFVTDPARSPWDRPLSPPFVVRHGSARSGARALQTSARG